MKPAIALIAGCCLAASSWAADPGAAEDTIARAATPPLGGVSITPANDEGTLRWAAWQLGAPPSRSVHLTFYDATHAPARPLWSKEWPDAYNPLVQATGWTHAGRPVLALTMQFGAAAQQVDLYGLDAASHPVRMAEMLGAAVGWVVHPDRTVLIVYQTPVSALVPHCFDWQDRTGQLAEVKCPAQ